MKISNPFTFGAVAFGIVLSTTNCNAEEAHSHERGGHSKPAEEAVKTATPATPAKQEHKFVLPPPPEGVTDLAFVDLFKMPIGRFGLELTEKLIALDGKKVRMLGHMVREAEEKHEHGHGESHGEEKGEMKPTLDRYMFTQHPAYVNTAHYCLAEDLPPQVVFVTLDKPTGQTVPYVSGALVVTGTLSLGQRQEPEGRNSLVRLQMSEPAISAALLESGQTTDQSAQKTPSASSDATTSGTAK